MHIISVKKKENYFANYFSHFYFINNRTAQKVDGNLANVEYYCLKKKLSSLHTVWDHISLYLFWYVFVLSIIFFSIFASLAT